MQQANSHKVQQALSLQKQQREKDLQSEEGGSNPEEEGRTGSCTSLSVHEGIGSNAVRIDYERVFQDQALSSAVALADGRFIDCNKRFILETGFSREELLSSSIFSLVDPVDRTNAYEAVGGMLNDNGEVSRTAVVFRAFVRVAVKQEGGEHRNDFANATTSTVATKPSDEGKRLRITALRDQKGLQKSAAMFLCLLI
mmetsp:Transcript_4759/g.5716  ORF Transcript_4759/g.5716 Transcript_4759/m.5716 type:complete len:198 (-) Transcript_4759:241-834(-)